MIFCFDILLLCILVILIIILLKNIYDKLYLVNSKYDEHLSIEGSANIASVVNSNNIIANNINVQNTKATSVDANKISGSSEKNLTMGDIVVEKQGGLVIGKEWGGNGNLVIDGDLFIRGASFNNYADQIMNSIKLPITGIQHISNMRWMNLTNMSPI